MTVHVVDNQGNYLGGWDGSPPPVGSIPVPMAPDDARQHWNGASWDPLNLPVLTPLQKATAMLAAYGMTIADFKKALGL